MNSHKWQMLSSAKIFIEREIKQIFNKGNIPVIHLQTETVIIYSYRTPIEWPLAIERRDIDRLLKCCKSNKYLYISTLWLHSVHGPLPLPRFHISAEVGAAPVHDEVDDAGLHEAALIVHGQCRHRRLRQVRPLGRLPETARQLGQKVVYYGTRNHYVDQQLVPCNVLCIKT